MTELPAHLGPSGRALYKAAVEEFALSLPELAALLQSAETLDALRIIEDSIRNNGPITDSGRPNPLLAEALRQRAILVRLLGLLDLRIDDQETPRRDRRLAVRFPCCPQGRTRPLEPLMARRIRAPEPPLRSASLESLAPLKVNAGDVAAVGIVRATVVAVHALLQYEESWNRARQRRDAKSRDVHFAAAAALLRKTVEAHAG